MSWYEWSLIAACLSIFINYCIGKPGSEFSPYEIFSSYTVWLSVRRLRSLDLYDSYAKQYQDNLTRTITKAEIVELKNDLKRILYNAADPFFTWERAVGICSICTGFWISLIISILAKSNVIEVVGIVVISHVLIRIFNKII